MYGTVATYRDYGIDYNIYGTNEYTVQFCGDDYEFSTIEDAKRFIDTIWEG